MTHPVPCTRSRADSPRPGLRWRQCALATIVLLTSFPWAAGAQELPDWVKRTRLSGLVFGDLYTMAANHNADTEGANGLWFRRVYLTVDNQIDSALLFRFRYEMNSAGDFTSDSKLTPFVKDLSLTWSRGRTKVAFGIIPSPTWDLAESFWGYRDVEKTPLDLQRLGSSRDVGVQIRGSVDAGQRIRYTVMVGQGSDVKGETNEGKKGYLSAALYPTKDLFLEVYGDYEDRPGATNRSVLQGLAGIRGAWGRASVLAAHQHRDRADATALNLDLVSGFVVIHAAPRLHLLARVDRMFDPNPEGDKIPYLPFDPTARSTLAMGGVDVEVRKRLHLIPNIQVVAYDGVTPRPDADLMLRTTFSITF